MSIFCRSVCIIGYHRNGEMNFSFCRVLVLEEKIDNIIKGFLGKTINRLYRKSDEWTAFFQKQIMEENRINEYS